MGVIERLGQRKVIGPHTLCGCYYCLSVFPGRRIDVWTKDGAALCPYCGIDSVVIDDISAAHLKQLNDELFGYLNDGKIIPVKE